MTELAETYRQVADDIAVARLRLEAAHRKLFDIDQDATGYGTPVDYLMELVDDVMLQLRIVEQTASHRARWPDPVDVLRWVEPWTPTLGIVRAGELLPGDVVAGVDTIEGDTLVWAAPRIVEHVEGFPSPAQGVPPAWDVHWRDKTTDGDYLPIAQRVLELLHPMDRLLVPLSVDHQWCRWVDPAPGARCDLPAGAGSDLCAPHQDRARRGQATSDDMDRLAGS